MHLIIHKVKLIELQGETEKSTIIVGDFNIPQRVEKKENK